jgi:hypothetical protein
VGIEDSQQGVKEYLTLRAREEEGPSERGRAEKGVCTKCGIRARKCLLSKAERDRIIMMPKRERQSPSPKDRDARRRGRSAGNPEMERQMKDLRARLEEMETGQRRGVGAGDLSDSKVEEEARHEEEVTTEDASTE